MLVNLLPILGFLHLALAHGQHVPQPSDTNAAIDVSQEPWTSKYGAQSDLGYSGPLSFSHLPYTRCLEDATQPFDIGVIGFPFDTATSHRPGEFPLAFFIDVLLIDSTFPGARFGPYAIRSGSRRQHFKEYSLAWSSNPYELGSKMIDCGDVSLLIPVYPSFFVALMYVNYLKTRHRSHHSITLRLWIRWRRRIVLFCRGLCSVGWGRSTKNVRKRWRRMGRSILGSLLWAEIIPL